MRIGVMLAIAVTVATAGTAQAGKGSENPDRLIAGRTPGKPEQCISQTRIVDTRTFDDGSIYYRMAGSNDYLNRPHDCSELKSDRSYVTQTPSTQLCSGDTLRIYDPTSHISYGACIFDQFVPYPKVRKP